MAMLVGFFGLSAGVYAQPVPDASAEHQPSAQTITLKDGTVLKGHLSAVSDNDYVISTANLGQVHVAADEILSITSGQPPAGQPSSSVMSAPLASQSTLNNLLSNQPQLMGQVSQTQQQILNDPQVMDEIRTALNDPEILQLLQDKSVMQDVMSFDPNRIQNNSNIQALMQNPKMQDILNLISGKMGGAQPSANSPPPE